MPRAKKGRKGKYADWLTEDGLTCVEGWARDGLTELDISKNMGISLSTLADWKVRFPNFLDALKRGKAPVDFKVENALLKRALGYTYTEVKTIELPDGTCRIESTVKEVLPDTTAQIFWLKNRRMKQWRDKPVPTGETETLERAKEILGELESVID